MIIKSLSCHLRQLQTAPTCTCRYQRYLYLFYFCRTCTLLKSLQMYMAPCLVSIVLVNVNVHETVQVHKQHVHVPNSTSCTLHIKLITHETCMTVNCTFTMYTKQQYMYTAHKTNNT